VVDGILQKGNKKLKGTLIVVLIITVISGCYSDKNKNIFLSATDSLGWQDNEEYSFTNPIDLEIIDDLLYVVDMNLSEIKVFDPQTMKYISTLGKKGNGPGEFSSPISICEYENGTLAVNEIGNRRTQILSRQGEYLKKIDYTGQWKLSSHKDQYYTGKLPLIPGTAGIYKIESDSMQKVFDLASWLETQNLPQFPKNFFSFTTLDDFFVISFNYSPLIIMLDKQGNLIEIEFEKIDFLNKNRNLGQPQPFKRGFLIPTNSYDEEKESKIDTKLIYYNLAGSIEKVYHLSDLETFVFETMAVSGNNVFLINDAVIYKYVLE